MFSRAFILNLAQEIVLTDGEAQQKRLLFFQTSHSQCEKATHVLAQGLIHHTVTSEQGPRAFECR